MRMKNKPALLISIAIFLMLVCHNNNKIQGLSIKELKKKNTVMLIAEEAQGFSWPERIFTVYYDGKIEIGSDCSGEYQIIGTSKLSDQAYATIIRYLDNKYTKRRCVGRNIMCDGEAWTIEYYDVNGKAVQKYDGFAIGCGEFEGIQNILYEYATTEKTSAKDIKKEIPDPKIRLEDSSDRTNDFIIKDIEIQIEESTREDIQTSDLEIE